MPRAGLELPFGMALPPGLKPELYPRLQFSFSALACPDVRRCVEGFWPLAPFVDFTKASSSDFCHFWVMMALEITATWVANAMPGGGRTGNPGGGHKAVCADPLGNLESGYSELIHGNIA